VWICFSSAIDTRYIGTFIPENTTNRNQVLKILAEHRERLATEFGVKSLALFGSVVRDEATPVSDVDLLVEFDGRPVGLFHLSRTQHYLESILGVSKVDLVFTRRH